MCKHTRVYSWWALDPTAKKVKGNPLVRDGMILVICCLDCHAILHGGAE